MSGSNGETSKAAARKARFRRELHQLVRRAMAESGLSLEQRQRRDAKLSVWKGRDGLPLAVGRHYRTATDAQRIALRCMYRSCAFPVCDRGFDHCQIHHVTPWEHGGVTDLGNLIPLCSQRARPHPARARSRASGTA